MKLKKIGAHLLSEGGFRIVMISCCFFASAVVCLYRRNGRSKAGCRLAHLGWLFRSFAPWGTAAPLFLGGSRPPDLPVEGLPPPTLPAGGLGGGNHPTRGSGGREPPRIRHGVWGAAAPQGAPSLLQKHNPYRLLSVLSKAPIGPFWGAPVGGGPSERASTSTAHKKS